MKTIVITSGYFNPIHPGHIECLQLCKELGDELWVIVNNDEQAKAKTGKQEVFQNEEFRMQVVSAIKYVDEVFLSVDNVDLVNDPLIGICESIKVISNKIREKYGPDTKIIFGKGGDRMAENIPEVQVCKKNNIQIRDGLGIKTHNSSDFRNEKYSC